MFKLGVYRLDQYLNGSPARLAEAVRAKLSRHRISFQLLRTTIPASAKQVSLFEKTLPLVQLSNGVFRTTFRGRFQQLDGLVNALLGEHFDSSAALDVHDWAASDCLTSREWAGSLLAQYPNAHLTASDLALFLIEAGLPNGEAFIIETNGKPLQYIRPPFVIRFNPPEPKLLVVNWLLQRHGWSKLQTLQPQWKLPAEWLDSEGGGDFTRPPFVFRKLSLIHPDAEALRAASDRFMIRRHSAFEALPQPCDVIRTMNIFNVAYFSEGRLLEGVRAVGRSLVKGGIWIVGRTFRDDPPSHNVSVFVKEAQGFKLLRRFGEGSEIEDVALRAGAG